MKKKIIPFLVVISSALLFFQRVSAQSAEANDQVKEDLRYGNAKNFFKV